VSGRPWGLALSGGGIRAASFHLGVVQGLARGNILPWMDYISAVSGGSFIAAWLAKWFRAESYGQVIESLKAGVEPLRIRQLRAGASYLTPRIGPFGTDTLLFLATYIHQLVLYAVVLLLTATLIVTIPYLFLLLGMTALVAPGWALALAKAAVALLTFSIALMVQYYVRSQRKIGILSPLLWLRWAVFPVWVLAWCWKAHQLFGSLEPKNSEMPEFIGAVVAAVLFDMAWLKLGWRGTHKQPIIAGATLVASYFLCFSIFRVAIDPATSSHVSSMAGALKDFVGEIRAKGTSHIAPSLWFKIAFFSSALAAIIVAIVHRRLRRWLNTDGVDSASSNYESSRIVQNSISFISSAILIYALLWYLEFRRPSIFYHFGFLLCPKNATAAAIVLIYCVITPIFITVFGLTGQAIIGLLGAIITPHVRESTMRTLTYLYKWAGFATFVFIAAFFGPPIAQFIGVRPSLLILLIVLILLLTWILRLFWRGTRFQRIAIVLVDHFVAYVLFTSFLIGASWFVVHSVLGVIVAPADTSGAFTNFWADVSLNLGDWVMVAWLLNLVAVLLLAVRFGNNSSSMHLFYQGRLARAFLAEFLPGAEFLESMHAPKPIRLAELARSRSFVGPCFLFNSTLNLGRADDLARQVRQAANFVFSPNFCGFHLPSWTDDSDQSWYLETERFDEDGGITLGQAMTISASAIGSNMGVRTSPKGRFINTLLNLRLGWWIPNPRVGITDSESEPWWGIYLLWKEIMGKTSATGRSIHLSDGGHFENLGLYELVRRRCQVIIASDASEDRNKEFRSLADAIEKSRVDLGARITIDCEPLRQKKLQHAVAYGNISYADGSHGLLVYIKPTMVRNSPIDLRHFKIMNVEFPHHSTTDQWFGEPQFESYRMLGETIAKTVCERAPEHDGDFRAMLRAIRNKPLT
jgi:hypothetical protein